MHPVRVLLDLVPELLVEPRQVRGAGGAAAGLPLHRRQPRPGDQRAPRRPRGSVPPLPLPHDHELRGRLPEGPESDAGHRKDQGVAGQARCLMDREIERLKWRSRRGLLELDLVFERFWAREPNLAPGVAKALERVLAMADNDLLDLVMGRAETKDPALR